jgi:hypothetical protein
MTSRAAIPIGMQSQSRRSAKRGAFASDDAHFGAGEGLGVIAVSSSPMSLTGRGRRRN